MDTKIKEINNVIAGKCDRLKEKAKRDFSLIVLPNFSEQSEISNTTKIGNLPPISLILFGAAAVSLICVFTTESTVLFIIATVLCAFGGYYFSKNNKAEKPNQHIDKMQMKTELSAKIIDCVKNISSEWDEFIELKQKELQGNIMSSSMPEEKKDQMLSKIYLHEIIDISLSDLTQMLNGIPQDGNCCTGLQKVKNDFLNKFLNAIDVAANKQIARYNSLLN